TRSEVRMSLSVADAEAKQFTDIVAPYRANFPAYRIAWIDQRVLYAVSMQTRSSVRAVGPAAGAKDVELLSDGVAPVATLDGKTLVVVSRGGTLWRADSDG